MTMYRRQSTIDNTTGQPHHGTWRGTLVIHTQDDKDVINDSRTDAVTWIKVEDPLDGSRIVWHAMSIEDVEGLATHLVQYLVWYKENTEKR